MSGWQLILVSVLVVVVRCAVIRQQGLYSSSDHVTILSTAIFDRNVYGKNYAQLVQFYNSYCGHCRAFAPVFKDFARDITPWNKVFRLAVIDCFNEANVEICRQFEVMVYPSLRYIPENYTKANGNIGIQLTHTGTADKLRDVLIHKFQEEQRERRFLMAPSLSINSYSSVNEAVQGVPRGTPYTFLVLESVNSTVGSSLILDTIDYKVAMKRVQDGGSISKQFSITNYPSVVAVDRNMAASAITLRNPTEKALLNSINSYLADRNYDIPEPDNKEDDNPDDNSGDDKVVIPDEDVVYYSDLEKTVRMTLNTEITRFKSLPDEAHSALMDYLQVLIDHFPFKRNENFKTFLIDLQYNLRSAKNVGGDHILRIVKDLEATHNPYKAHATDYIGCKGSQPQYRGFTCGLWTLFHTLVTNAAARPGKKGPKVLQTMKGYVKNFFGCTHCVQHFLAMAERNKLNDVTENDKAVLWLWISHNEVNLRLAGDVTEDPKHPKVQFPSKEHCPECRQASGSWNLPAVFNYLHEVYGAAGVRDVGRVPSNSGSITDLDIGMLSFLYLFSFIIIILVIKYFFTKRFYRNRLYKHGRGKV